MKADIHISTEKQLSVEDRRVIVWLVAEFWLHPDLLEMEASTCFEDKSIRLEKMTLVEAILQLAKLDLEEQIVELVEHRRHFTGWFLSDSTAGVMGFPFHSALFLHPQSGYWYHVG